MLSATSAITTLAPRRLRAAEEDIGNDLSDGSQGCSAYKDRIAPCSATPSFGAIIKRMLAQACDGACYAVVKRLIELALTA